MNKQIELSTHWWQRRETIGSVRILVLSRDHRPHYHCRQPQNNSLTALSHGIPIRINSSEMTVCCARTTFNWPEKMKGIGRSRASDQSQDFIWLSTALDLNGPPHKTPCTPWLYRICAIPRIQQRLSGKMSQLRGFSSQTVADDS